MTSYITIKVYFKFNYQRELIQAILEEIFYLKKPILSISVAIQYIGCMSG